MPEGDAVWRTARRLDRGLAGQVLTRSDLRVPQLATVDLAGQRVLGTLTRGKHLLTRIGEDWTLHTHLKMEGSWAVLRPRQRWPKPTHTARAVLHTEAAVAVGFSLGIVELLRRADEEQAFAYLGPDLLATDWDDAAEADAVRRLQQHADERIFDALRDQTSLAGLGTLWAAEVLFTRGVHPETPVREVSDLLRLVRVARLKLQQAAASRAPVPAAVYGRSRGTCLRCGTRIQRLELGEEHRPRPAYLCPSCQPRKD